MVSEQFGLDMAHRAFKIDTWVRSDRDFAEMSWHDVIIHAMAASTELSSRPVENRRWSPVIYS